MSSAPRLVASDPRDDDADATLRPQRLTEFIGQEQARANLNVFIEAARAQGSARPCALCWSTRARQDDTGADHCA